MDNNHLPNKCIPPKNRKKYIIVFSRNNARPVGGSSMLADTYLRAVHCVVKLFGLTPFRHDCHNDAQPATPSKAAFAYAAIIGLAYNTFVCWSFAMLTGDSSDETVYVALHVKHVCKLAQSVGTFWSLFYYRLTLIESLNMAKRIRCQLASLLPAGALRDADTTRIVHNVLVWTMVQSGLTIGSMCVFAAYASMRALCFALIMFCSSFFSMVLTLLQFATILEVAQMYRALNKKLRTCVERIRQVSQMPRRCKMRMQMFCDVSDDVDKIAQLFKLVSLFNGQVCRVFSVSMLVNIVNSFAYALFAVKHIYINDEDFFFK